MDFSKLAKDTKGQANAVNTQIQLIVALMVAIIVIYQLFISGVGPTTDDVVENGIAMTTAELDNVDNENTWSSNPNYDTAALNAWTNVQLLSWAGIGLMAVVIIILAAAVLMQVIRGGFGGGGV